MVAICAVYKFSRGLTYFVAAVVEFVVNIFTEQSMILCKQRNDINADTP